nr:S-adenosylmethionine synthetase N-terminal domain-containing protein [Candidatus Paceibacterota bacterium]
MNRYLTSEYVGIGHPDKVADQISDGILDMYLGNDPNSRVAVETLVSGNKVFVVGEITSRGKFSESFIKDKINEIIVDAGYDCNVPCEFREGNLDIQLHLRAQSPNIHQGVDK